MGRGKFDRLVKKGIIRRPRSFSESEIERINGLTSEEVKALISIRAKLGSSFIRKKATGRSPSIAIVF